MKDMLDVLVGLAALFSTPLIVSMWKNLRKNNLRDLVLLIAAECLQKEIYDVLDQPNMTNREYQKIFRLFNAYKAAGGNGYLDSLFTRLSEKPIEIQKGEE